jgi:hypothetical protein
MKNTTLRSKNSKIRIILAVVFAAVLTFGSAVPAFAQMTTGSYADQFGIYHTYNSYNDYANQAPVYSGSAYNTYYGTGYNRTYYGTRTGANCITGEYYDAFNNVCFPVSRRSATGIAGDNLEYSYNGIKTTSGTTKTSTTKTTTTSDNYQASAISTLFGGKKDTKLAIGAITVTSGPKNINEKGDAVNCDVRVNWTTTVPSAGQVVYGTVSQPNIANFSYPFTAVEGNSYQKNHEVKLGCLENAAYSLRVVAFSEKERVVSDEQKLLPFKLLTDIPAAGNSVSAAGASAAATLGSWLTSPIVLVLLVGLVVFMVIRRMLRKNVAGHGDTHAAPVHAEPALQIPHH